MRVTSRKSLQSVAMTIFFVIGIGGAFGQQFQEVEARHLKHILVATEAQIDAVIAKLEKGQKFSALARRHSFDVRTKVLGGDLGFLKRGDGLDPDFERAAWSIKNKGEWAKGKSVFGWFVVQLVDVRKENVQVQPGQVPSTPPNTPPTTTPRSIRDDYIKIDFEFEKKSSAPGDDLFVSITIKNDTQGREGVEPEVIEIPRPRFWPLGITLRMQGQSGGRNRALTLPGNAPTKFGDFVQPLQPGQQLTQRFRMQDYIDGGVVPTWPLIRTNWRGNILMANMNRLAPELGERAKFNKMNQRWRFYYGGEQHLNVLPRYEAGDRWFAVMDVNGGKLWVELEDPGVPGVLKHWMRLVRSEYYDRFPFARHEPGEFVLGGDRKGDGTGRSPEKRALGPNWRQTVKKHELDTVSLRVFSEGSDFVGGQLYFCRENPSVLDGKAVPIGKIVQGQRTMELLMQAMSETKKTSLTRVDLYHESLIPTRMRPVLGLGELAAETQPVNAGDIAKKAATAADHSAQDVTGLAKDLPKVMMATQYGPIYLELYEDHAPNTVAHFLELVDSGFYNGLSFHRREGDEQEGFIQGGSSDGTGKGGLDYFVPDEISDMRHLRGALSLARLPSRPNTGGCQFFICLGPMPNLDGEWTVFGRITQGLQLADMLQAGDKIQGMKVMSRRNHAYGVDRLPNPDAKKAAAGRGEKRPRKDGRERKPREERKNRRTRNEAATQSATKPKGQ